MKTLLWVGSSRADLRAFPDDARSVAGYQLWLVQRGLEPHDWKPMASIGPGVTEIRIRTGREHRVFYVAKFSEGIYVLHAFEKKSRTAAKADMARGRARFTEVLLSRRPLVAAQRR